MERWVFVPVFGGLGNVLVNQHSGKTVFTQLNRGVDRRAAQTPLSPFIQSLPLRFPAYSLPSLFHSHPHCVFPSQQNPLYHHQSLLIPFNPQSYSIPAEYSLYQNCAFDSPSSSSLSVFYTLFPKSVFIDVRFVGFFDLKTIETPTCIGQRVTFGWD